MSNGYVIIESENNKVLVKKNGRWEVRFGFDLQESGYYRCVMFSCLRKPTYEEVCSIVDKYNKENCTDYVVTREQYVEC